MSQARIPIQTADYPAVVHPVQTALGKRAGSRCEGRAAPRCSGGSFSNHTHTHTCSCVPLADWWQCVRAPLRWSAGLRLRNRDQNGSPLQLQLSNYLILISLLHLGLGCLFVDPLLDLHIDRRDLLALEQLPGARTGLSPRHHVGLFWAAPLAGG